MAKRAARNGTGSPARLSDEDAELTDDDAVPASDDGPASDIADAGLAGDDQPSAGDQARLAGRYRLEERLSEHSGSTVWKATDKALARVVTVRTFAPGFRRTGPVVAAARAASQLNDRRLVQIFDADDSADHRYIVSEWPSGERLDDVLVIGPLEPLRAVEIITDAANAIAVAHAAGLAHLCLTPDSLWCNTRSEVKIIGLGTAAALAGARADDPALTDTLGLASLLYATLTGYWPGTEATRLPAAPRSDGRAQSPAELRADIPSDIEAVTCRALFGEAGGYGPAILSPAELAVELAAIVASSGSRSYSQAPNVTQPLTLALGRASDRRRPSAQGTGRPRPRTQPLPLIPTAAAAPAAPSSAPPAQTAPPPAQTTPPPAATTPPPAQTTRPAAETTPPPGPVTTPRGPATPPPGPVIPPPGTTTPQSGPGAPGVAAPAPGVAAPAPGVAAPAPGVAAAEPGVAAPGPGVAAAEPGVAAAEPAGPGSAAASPIPAPAPRRRADRMAGRPGWRPAFPPLPAMPAAAAKPLRAAAVILVLALSAAGGWLLAHGGTAAPRHQAAAPGTAPVHRPAQSRTLRPVSAATFDPYGDGQGRSDQLAPLAIDAKPATAWHTAWYTTAAFGNLKPGTGLLLDMGRPVTVTGIKITLGSRHGGSFQVRTGAAATSLSDLHQVTRTTGTGGQVDLRLPRPAPGARYVLIWFTKLPPDAAGTFQATVYNVRVEGSG
jgi:hypothetical protein